MGTLVRNTTHIKRRTGGGWADIGVNGLKRRTSGGWVNVGKVARRAGGGWTYIYSTPDVNCSGGGATTGSGASSSGSASVGATATPSGNYISLSYSWSYVLGDGAIGPNNGSISNPTFSRNFLGVPNGTTSSGVSAVWRCTVTDTTGAQAYHDITIGPLAWQNIIPSFTPFNQDFNAGQSGTVNVPTGATTLTLYVVGGGAQGGAGFNDGMGDEQSGGGASGAGMAVWQGNVSGNIGTAINYSVGFASAGFISQGQSSATSGLVGLTATGGYPGGNASSGNAGAGAASVGLASGGNVANYSGDQGGHGGSGFSPGSGGGAGGGGLGFGYGGSGGIPIAGGDLGGNGFIRFAWT